MRRDGRRVRRCWFSWFVVEAQVCGGEFEIQEIGAPGEVQRAGARGVSLALLEDVLDVLAGERLAGDGVIDGAGDFVGPVDVGEGDDLVDMDAGVEAAGAQLLVVVLCLRAQGVKGEQPLGVARPSALVEEFAHVIGVFKIAVPLVTAGMRRHHVVVMVEAEAVGERFEREPLRGVAGWHGVAVGVQNDAAAVGDPREPRDRGVGGDIRQWAQGRLFDLEEFLRDFACFRVDAGVGDGREPLPGGRVHGHESGRDIQAGEEVFLHVAHEVFHAPLFVGLAHIAGSGLEAVVGGEVEVARMKDGFLAERMQEHAGLEVVDQDRAGRAAKKFERVLVAGQEVLQAFPAGELDVGHARMAEHHHEKGEPPPRVSDGDAARAAPVHLRGLSGRKGQAQERGMPHRPHHAHIFLEDARPALVSLFAQALEDLRAAIRMSLQQARDQRLERVELARAFRARAWRKLFRPRVFGHRFRVDAQLGSDLVEAQPAFPVILADLAVCFVVDHGASIIERRISPMLRSSPTRGSGSFAATSAGSKLNT